MAEISNKSLMILIAIMLIISVANLINILSGPEITFISEPSATGAVVGINVDAPQAPLITGAETAELESEVEEPELEENEG